MISRCSIEKKRQLCYDKIRTCGGEYRKVRSYEYIAGGTEKLGM